MPQPFCAQHYFVLLETDDIQRGQNLKKGHLLVGNQKGKVEAEKEEQSQQPNNPTTRLKQTHRQPTPTHTPTLRRRRRRRGRRGRRNRTESWRGREERKKNTPFAHTYRLSHKRMEQQHEAQEHASSQKAEDGGVKDGGGGGGGGGGKEGKIVNTWLAVRCYSMQGNKRRDASRQASTHLRRVRGDITFCV